MASGIVVGAHPWVYAATQPGHDIYPILDDIFSDMSYAGMEGIELMHTVFAHEDAVEKLKELSSKHKLPVIGTSFGANMWDRSQHHAIYHEAKSVIQGISSLGGWTLGTSVGKAPQEKTPEQLDAQAELIMRISETCEQHGVTLNLHNHTYELEHDQHDLKGTLARVPESVKLGPDLNWCLRAGVDPAAFIRDYGDRIMFLHLRDQSAEGAWSEALGEGDMDYRAIKQALSEIDFRGPAVIELAHEPGFQLTRPLKESLKLSRDFVKSVLGW